MGSRRCCSCEQVLRCEGCCSDCMVSYTLERKGILLESGSPFGIEGDAENPAGNADPIMPQVPGDEIIVHFASSINVDNNRILPAPVQHSYKNFGSFWTWYPPAFMVDFNHHFPSCTTLPILDFGGGIGTLVLLLKKQIIQSVKGNKKKYFRFWWRKSFTAFF